MFDRDDELLSDLKRDLEGSSAEEVNLWALEMVRKPLSYLKGRYSNIYGLERFLEPGGEIDQKTAESVWKKLMRGSSELEDPADRVTIRAAAAFLRAGWDREAAMDAMVLLLSSIIHQDGVDEGTRGVPIVVFAAEDILSEIKKKIA